MKRFLTLKAFLPVIPVIMAMNPIQTPAQEPAVPANVTPAPDPGDRNNNFYDNVEMYALPSSPLLVTGEVAKPGPVDFTKLPVRTVIVKEALLNEDGSNRFVGAYRYDGYSLFDILQDYILDKANKETFKPIIDLYVVIENDKGEKTVLSWGEIYYPSFLHQVIIATRVGRIVPSKTKDLWPLPLQSKLVVVNDLITERNISNPVKITVCSYSRDFRIQRELSPLFAPGFAVETDGVRGPVISSLPKDFQTETLHTIFYGKGRGIHSTQPFSGIFLHELLKTYLPVTRTALQSGLVTLAGADGYRAVYTYSEIVNRNDQAAVLLVPCDTCADGGRYRIFPSCDFFSDRAVKALSDIILTTGIK